MSRFHSSQEKERKKEKKERVNHTNPQFDPILNFNPITRTAR